MALDSRYITAVDLNQQFFDKDTGEFLANGQIFFFVDSNRTQAKNVYTLSGAPGNYSYVPLSNSLTLSNTGTVVDNSGASVPIYYYPYDADGNLQLYFIEVFSALGVLQFTRQAWPNNAVTSSGKVIVVTTSPIVLAAGYTYICSNGNVTIDFVLPASANIGDTYNIIGNFTSSLGGWNVTQDGNDAPLNQFIQVGDELTTTGVDGRIASSRPNDSITLVCIIANTGFSTTVITGNLFIF